MAKLPRLSGKEVLRILTRQGFSIARQRGSHIALVKVMAEGKTTVIVPMHPELKKGTQLSIIRQAKLSREEFLRLL